MIATFVMAAALSGAPEINAEYVAKLTATPATAEAQFRLAEWARRHGMKDLADGHLRAAVYIDPKFAPAQKALGRTATAGVWETKLERLARVEREARLQEERQEWRRRLSELGIEEAVKGRSITEAAAAAIETFVSDDRGRALAAVRAFRGSDHGAATWGLIRQAVASPYAEARTEAAKALRLRNPDHYLPPLVEYQRPQADVKSVVLGVGEIWRWREGDVQVTALPAPLAPTSTSGNAAPIATLEERHAELDRLRANAAAALETATGLKLGNDFTKWQQVLPQISDAAVPDKPSAPKSEATTYYQPTTMVVGTRIDLPTGEAAGS